MLFRPMRGKVASANKDILPMRITPAYAGKSHVFNKCCINNWDHPRLCGEKYRSIRRFFPNSRITPAYAGKRSRENFSENLKKDHPRLCGEKRHFPNQNRRLRGSPPPMRGKAYLTSWHVSTARITPAYAGKSVPHTRKICLYIGITPAYAGKRFQKFR